MITEIFSVFVIILFSLLLVRFRETYSDSGASGDDPDPNMYNYPRENPNALLKGKIIGGTVYSDYPMSIPGLGWIL